MAGTCTVWPRSPFTFLIRWRLRHQNNGIRRSRTITTRFFAPHSLFRQMIFFSEMVEKRLLPWCYLRLFFNQLEGGKKTFEIKTTTAAQLLSMAHFLFQWDATVPVRESKNKQGKRIKLARRRKDDDGTLVGSLQSLFLSFFFTHGRESRGSVWRPPFSLTLIPPPFSFAFLYGYAKLFVCARAVRFCLFFFPFFPHHDDSLLFSRREKFHRASGHWHAPRNSFLFIRCLIAFFDASWCINWYIQEIDGPVVGMVTGQTTWGRNNKRDEEFFPADSLFIRFYWSFGSCARWWRPIKCHQWWVHCSSPFLEIVIKHS